eukprot:131798-Rhodomonas_salina.2
MSDTPRCVKTLSTHAQHISSCQRLSARDMQRLSARDMQRPGRCEPRVSKIGGFLARAAVGVEHTRICSAYA